MERKEATPASNTCTTFFFHVPLFLNRYHTESDVPSSFYHVLDQKTSTNELSHPKGRTRGTYKNFLARKKQAACLGR